MTHVAMESTGVYWVPIWNVLEGHFQLLLVNAQHLKKVPGRKDDVSDSEWIAQCQQCGLLRSIFVPPLEVRQWRQLTRQRLKLADGRKSVINRLHSVLEQGNIKLSQVASNIVGVSGRAMINAMSKGENDPARLAALARGRLSAKYEQLVESPDGHLHSNQRWLLKRLLEQLQTIEREIAIYSDQIKAQMSAYQTIFDRLDTISGVGRRTAETILAEIGPQMAQFPTADHLVSWAATLERDSYLAALYRRLAPRRGKKRAIIAVARTILEAAWHMLKEEVEYKELGGDYFERLSEEKTTGYLVKRLRKLGYEVELTRKLAAWTNAVAANRIATSTGCLLPV